MSNSGIPPVDIEFVVKNTDFSAATKEVKKEIIDVGVTAEKVSKQVEDNLVNSLNNTGKAAAGVGGKFGSATGGVAQFSKGMNGLQVSMQQVARELPTLALSPQMFMLAISNNLPILQDQIRKTRIENELLKASGQSTVPVWKQLVSSLFSWQTALVAGITIFTVYGKDIFAFLGNLFGLAKGFDSVKIAQQQASEAMSAAAQASAKESVNLEILYKATQDANRTLKERNEAVDELQSKFPEYFGNMSNEAILAGEAASQYTKLKDAIFAKAKAQAFADKVAENELKIFELQQKGGEKVGKTIGLLQGVLGIGLGTSAGSSLSKNINEEIKGLNEINESLRKSINISELLFDPKPGKKTRNKEVNEQTRLMAELDAAVKSGSQTAIDEAAKRIAIYEQEKDLLREIIELAAFEMKYADQHKNIAPMQSKGIGSVDKGDIKNIDSPNGRKILYEVTAINKTGPVWKKIGLESDKLKKLITDNAKEADQLQKEIDEDELRRKQQIREDLLNYSRQFTSELIQQLDLTNEQAKALEGVADVVFNLLSGNPIAAAFSGASALMTLLFSKDSKKDPTTEALENVNNLLRQQSAILANLAGTNYFELATKQYDDLGKVIDLNNQKLKERNTYSSEEYERLKKVWENGPAKQGIFWDQFLKASNQQGLIKKIDTSQWSPEQFVDAYASGSAILDEQQIEWVKGIVETQKQRAELLQETWDKITGTTRDSIADSIVEGFQNGYDSAEDFADNFEELMKTAIINSFKTKLIEEDLTKWYSGFAEVAKDGLTADEIAEQQRLWDEMIEAKKLDWEKIAEVTGIDMSNAAESKQQGLSGSISGITEEQADLLAGLFTALRIDVKEILKNMAAADNDTVQSLAYLKEIAENTRHNVRLKAIEEGITKTNKLLDERL